MHLFLQLKWFFKQQAIRYIIAMILLIGVALLSLLPPWIIGRVVDEAHQQTLTTHLLLTYTGWLVMTGLVVYVLRYLWRLSLYSASFQLGTQLRAKLYNSWLYRPPRFFQRFKTGDLMARATNDVTAVEMSAGEAILALFDGLLTGIAVVIVLSVTISWKLTLIALIPWPFMALFFWQITRRLHSQYELAQERFSDLNNHVQESISGIRLIKCYGLGDIANSQFEQATQQAREANIAVDRTEQCYDPVIIGVMGSAFFLTLAGGTWLISLGEITIGQLTSFTLYLGQLVWPMFAYGWLLNLLKRGEVAYGRIEELLNDENHSVTQAATPSLLTSPSDESNALSPGSFTLSWSIKSFRYPDTEHPVITSCDGELKQGHIIGIVGPTGCGKTTLLNLLLGLEPLASDERNQITLTTEQTNEPLNLNHAPLLFATLRTMIAYVPQEAFLFSTSIRDNLLIGDPNADTTTLDWACSLAQIDADITQLPDGYDTLVGERGVTLSGGQKQRLSLARALLKRAPILILDDALSAVDHQTEQAILTGLKTLQCAMIIVTHRLSALRQADNILVLEQGQLTEQGNHDALLSQMGWYAKIVKHQQLDEQLVSTPQPNDKGTTP